MQKLIVLLFMVLATFSATAQDGGQGGVDEEHMFDPPIIFSADEVDLNEFLWIKRPLIVFADAPADPRYVQQMQNISQRLDALNVRDVVVITDTDPAAESDLRKRFRPRGFMFVLLDKDGTIYLRKPFPWDVREISRSIDKLPSRQREMNEGPGDS